MLAWIRRRATYANVALTLALVFAMTGGAYAAKKYLITSTKQISPKVLRQLKGARGPVGPEGKQGPAGANGKDGAQGLKGEAGVEGKAGANGTSVTSKESKSNIGPCAQGGSEFKAGSSTTYACNGGEGKEGSPWTDKGVLPKGATETGNYALYTTAAAEGEFKATAISFPIQLAEKPEATAHWVPLGATASAPCKGTVTKPEAEAPKEGEAPNLCLFEGASFAIGKGGLKGATTILGPGGGPGEANVTGAELAFETTKPGEVSAEGTWAVTG